MAYQERTIVEFVPQEILYPGETEYRYLRVESVEIGPGQFVVLNRGPELTAAGYRKLVLLQVSYREIEGPDRIKTTND
jgi:hypothetical protein